MTEQQIRSFTELVTEYCKEQSWNVKFFSERTLIATPVGLWQIRISPFDDLLLFHHNYLRGLGAITHPDAMQHYHRQRDAKVFAHVTKLLNYILRHDTSKAYELKGIKQMPAHTQKQREWIKHAKARKRRRDANNVIKLIDRLKD